MVEFTRNKQCRETHSKSVGSVSIRSAGNRIVCPRCGNDWHFYEIAEDVTLTTKYVQNSDGSFTPQFDDSRILGEVKFFCGECKADLTRFHNRFVEMLF